MSSNAKVLVKFLPFGVRLEVDTSQNRRLSDRFSPVNIFSASKERQTAFSLNLSELTETLKTYFDDFLNKEFDNANGKTIYAPFSHVSLSSIGMKRRRNLVEGVDIVEMDGIFNSPAILDSVEDSVHLESELDIVPVRSGNLRKRNMSIVVMNRRYDGVAVFTRDGDLPIPSANYVQAKQLQAQADENGALLNMLQKSDKRTGLNAVTNIELGVSTSEGTTPVYDDDYVTPNNTASSGKNSFDAVIIIAVVVAACSMFLLGFAIFLAFRRRQDSVPQKTNEITPTTRGSDQVEVVPRQHHRSRRNAPPVLEIKQSGLQNDDAISEYTESVYSLPSVVKNAKKAWIQQSVEASTAKHTSQRSRHQRTSTRFKPKYILSSRSNASSSADEGDLLFDDHGATEEMAGVPQMTSPMKLVLQETEKKMALNDSAVDNSVSTAETNNRTSKTVDDHADVIDDDIMASLATYPHEYAASKRNDDDASVDASYVSYGFSLDGADYNTVAGSTKYGY